MLIAWRKKTWVVKEETSLFSCTYPDLHPRSRGVVLFTRNAVFVSEVVLTWHLSKLDVYCLILGDFLLLRFRILFL
jgi:hypothetical protein